MVCSDTGVRIGDGDGACLHLRAVHDSLLELGHEVRLVGVAAPDPARVRSWGSTCRTVPDLGRGQGAEGARGTRAVVERVHWLASRVTDRWRPDLVYERLSPFGTAGQRIAASSGVPHVLEVNALLAVPPARWRGSNQAALARVQQAQVLAGAQVRIVVSREVADRVDSVVGSRSGTLPGALPGRTLVVPNGVDARLFTQAPGRALVRRRLGLANGTFAVGFTGSLRPGHGLDVALQALTQLDPDVHLIVAGHGPDLGRLQDLTTHLGVAGRVRWLGQVLHDRVPGVLAACDVAIAPYLPQSGFGFSPLKLYEYLAAGLPVVASDLGQLREVLAGEPAGVLVRPGDPGDLARALLRVWADPTIGAAAAGRAASARAEHSWTGRVRRIMSALSVPAGQDELC